MAEHSGTRWPEDLPKRILQVENQPAEELLSSGESWQFWPHEGVTDRLRPLALPRIRPSFVLEPGSEVFTIGSCFARNIEDHLLALGFDVPAASYRGARLEWTGARPAGVMNAYTPPVLEWMLELGAAWGSGEELQRRSALEQGLLQGVDGLWLDTLLAHAEPCSWEQAAERRARILELLSRSLRAPAVVMTLGLTESWFDQETGLPMGRAPSAWLMRSAREAGQAGRFSYRQLRFEEVFSGLRSTLSRLQQRGHPRLRLLLTVSPVPLSRTWESEDVLIANQHSKSLLRAAAGELAREFGFVDYAPSYESIALSRDPTVWERDQRHVSERAVGALVQRIVRS